MSFVPIPKGRAKQEFNNNKEKRKVKLPSVAGREMEKEKSVIVTL